MGLLERRADWPERLAAVVASAQDQPYVLGQWDCLRFCCAAIESMTGTDLWPRFAGYKTKRQALVTIARIAPSLGDAVSVVLAREPVAPAQAGRGDVALYHDGEGESHLGLCIGAKVAVLGPAGLLQVPLDHAGLRHAWRIG
jgi:cell wall-associated NlpC family hydrolase